MANYTIDKFDYDSNTYILEDSNAARKRNGVEYIKGTQTASTGSWTGVTEDSELYDGKHIYYYLPYAGNGNATLNLTLSDNTTTGAIEIYFNNNARVTTHFSVNSVISMTYDATNNRWRCDGEYDSGTACRLYNSSGLYKSYTALYRYQICLTKNETSLLPINTVNNSTATNKILTTESFDPFGPIYYYNSTSIVNANDNIGTARLYYQYLADLRYSFNTGTTLTARKAVYLVCVLGAGCSATLAPNPISQTLPTTDDGYIYVYLGQTYDNYRIELSNMHPVYRYIRGALRVVTSEIINAGYDDPVGGNEGDIYIKLNDDIPSDVTKAALEGQPVIPDNTVYDTLVIPGTYYVQNADKMANPPFREGHTLYILKPMANLDAYKVQVGVSWQGEISTRYTEDSGSTWTNWTTYPLISGQPVIEDGTNFNSLVVPRTYYVQNTSHAQTMVNPPFTNSGFMMYVIKPLDSTSSESIDTTGYVLQYAMSWRGIIKTRYTWNSGTDWSSWTGIGESSSGKHIMTASIDSNITSPTAGAFTKISLSSSNSYGTKLTFDSTNGGIRIGEGVSKILVSAGMSIRTGIQTNTRYLVIVKNNYLSNNTNTLGWVLKTIPADTSEDMLVIHPILADVSPNDVIYLYYYVRSGDIVGGASVSNKTSLTVEVVG